MGDSIQEDAGTMRDIWLNDYNKKLAMQSVAMAEAYGIPGVPPNCGITRVVNNFPAPPAAPSAAPVAAPAPASPAVNPVVSAVESGISPVLKGALLGFGAPALLAAGSFLPGLLGSGGTTLTPATTPSAVAAPATAPDQSVTVGIDATGKLIVPTETN